MFHIVKSDWNILQNIHTATSGISSSITRDFYPTRRCGIIFNYKRLESRLVTFSSGQHSSQLYFILLRREHRRACLDGKAMHGESVVLQHKLVVVDFLGFASSGISVPESLERSGGNSRGRWLMRSRRGSLRRARRRKEGMQTIFGWRWWLAFVRLSHRSLECSGEVEAKLKIPDGEMMMSRRLLRRIKIVPDVYIWIGVLATKRRTQGELWVKQGIERMRTSTSG